MDGYVYLQLSPFLAYDTEAQIEECQRLWATLNRPNCGIKIPATSEGIIAIRRLISQGINVTATLVFSPDVYSNVREAYFTGLKDLIRTGGDPGKVSSLVAFPLSRIDTLVDGLLQERIRQGEAKFESSMGKAAIATARLAYQDFKEAFRSPHFVPLRAKGACVQRLLWASTRAKNPRYSDLMYVEPLIGKDSVNTMPAITIKAFLEHGQAEASLEKDVADAHQTMAALAEAGINMKQVTTKLLDGGIQTFVDSFSRLLAGIDRKIKS